MLYLTCSTRYSRPAASFSGSFGAVWDVIECSGKPHHSVELGKNQLSASHPSHSPCCSQRRLSGHKSFRDLAGLARRVGPELMGQR